jgi:2-amino-4-hydroxy-6-hydroxymethyldihydropteridine diphosphokinase
MKRVFLSLGGNVGDVKKTLLHAVELLSNHPDISNLQCSDFYTTAPVSDILQENFLNCVCSLSTSLSATSLFEEIEKIEKQLGKVPKPKNAPRCVDIDLIWYNGELIFEEGLQVPHPRWKRRLFVLIPLMDLVSHLGPYDLRQQIEKVYEEESNSNSQLCCWAGASADSDFRALCH